MDSVEVAGLRIAYQRAGAGPPLVLLHGAYEDSRVWRRQLDGLSDEFTELAVIPDVGHLAQCEAPEAFNAEVRRFLHALPA
jgi:pimeloyl-ACP methyl ester carboxylesterase